MVSEFPRIQESFYFKCTQCADCCTGEQSVWLNLFDLYKMAKRLKANHTLQLFQKMLVRLEKDPENNVFRPKIRFKAKPFLFCPFLINDMDEQGEFMGWCQLHPSAKPLVCALAPVGVCFDVQKQEVDYFLVPPTVTCPGLKTNKEQILKTYLAPYQRELEFQNRFFKILEKLKPRKWSENQFKEQLYTFTTDVAFSTILSKLEERIFNLETNPA